MICSRTFCNLLLATMKEMKGSLIKLMSVSQIVSFRTDFLIYRCDILFDKNYS